MSPARPVAEVVGEEVGARAGRGLRAGRRGEGAGRGGSVPVAMGRLVEVMGRAVAVMGRVAAAAGVAEEKVTVGAGARVTAKGCTEAAQHWP